MVFIKKELLLLTAIFSTSVFAQSELFPNFNPKNLKYASRSGTLFEIDASGYDGENGRNGGGYQGSASTGRDGNNGENASPATPGGPAGTIELKIKTDQSKMSAQNGLPFDGAIILEGDIQSPKNGQGKFSKEIAIQMSGSIFLTAPGGQGGNGGFGGDGEDGGRGYRGSDATRYSSGSNGGPGGDGGDAGAGTNGERGGNGGKIKLTVNADETHLLMLVENDVSGGKGGDAGAHGRPGDGGSGGSGGSSYSWSETEYYTDSDGKRQSRTQYYSHSGGYSGRSGSQGRIPPYGLRSGDNGTNGNFSIEVVDAQGNVKSYKSRYDLQLLGFNFREQDPDGVFEPNERVIVSNISIKNTGGMPLPKGREIVVFLENQNWTLSEPLKLVAPKSLASGESYTFKNDQLAFRIKDTTISDITESPFTMEERIRPVALMTGSYRYFQNFDAPQNFRITYPVRIEPMKALNTLEPGTGTKIFFKVTNISQRDYGSESEIKRLIQTKLKINGGDLRGKQVVFYDKNQRPANLDVGFLKAISNLKAGESALVEGVVGIDVDAIPGKELSLQTILNFGQIQAADAGKLIQFGGFKIKVGQVYKHSPNASILVVGNRSIDTQTVQFLKRTAINLGTELDYWDLSLNGHVNLTQALNDGQTLLEAFKNKSIIMLNGAYQNQGGDSVHATDYLIKNQFIKALSNYGISVLSLNDTSFNGHLFLQDLLLPESDGNVVNKYKSIGSLLSAIRPNGKDLSPLTFKERSAAAGFFDNYDQVNINEWVFFGKESKEHLEKRAKELNQKLENIRPERSYVVSYNYDSEVIQSWLWGAIKNISYGSIEVRETLDPYTGRAVMYQVDERKITDAQFYMSDEFYLAYFSSLSFDLKLDIIKRFKEKNVPAMNIPSVRRVFMQALLADIATEQSWMRSDGMNSAGLNNKEVNQRLIRLNKLANLDLGGLVEANGVLGVMLSEIFSQIKFMSNTSSPWFKYFIPFSRDVEITNLTNSILEKAVKKMISVLPNEKQNYFKSVFELRVKTLVDEAKARDQKNWEKSVFDQYEIKQSQTTDLKLSILEDSELKQRQDIAKQRQADIEMKTSQNQKAKDELGVKLK